MVIADSQAQLRQQLNQCRYRADKTSGHYESYFLRANHPSKPIAFWIRYTMFVPREAHRAALGELWAVVFDGEARSIVAVKEEVPLASCQFSAQGLDVALADKGCLLPGSATGEAASAGHRIRWHLTYAPGQSPLRLLPEALYDAPFPKAKALVANPNVRFSGTLVVDGVSMSVEEWQGSENHNWGSKHTDRYAWGQVAGFDNAPDAFLECATAKVKLGPVWTPWLTTVVLRVEDREIAINSIAHAVLAKATYNYFNWHFATSQGASRISCDIYAPRHCFVALNYYNPPGGSSTCLNSKIAGCRLVLSEKGQPDRVLETSHRAAFEILTKDADHGLGVVA
jgi:hypothetical protein